MVYVIAALRNRVVIIDTIPLIDESRSVHSCKQKHTKTSDDTGANIRYPGVKNLVLAFFPHQFLFLSMSPERTLYKRFHAVSKVK